MRLELSDFLPNPDDYGYGHIQLSLSIDVLVLLSLPQFRCTETLPAELRFCCSNLEADNHSAGSLSRVGIPAVLIERVRPVAFTAGSL